MPLKNSLWEQGKKSVIPSGHIKVGFGGSETIRGGFGIAVYGISLFSVTLLLYYSLLFPFAKARFTSAVMGGLIIIEANRQISDIYSTDQVSRLEVANILKYSSYIILGSFSSIYIFWQYNALITDRLLRYNTVDYLAGLILIIIVIDITYQNYGKVITAVILSSLVYGLFGFLFPGVFFHAGLSTKRFVSVLSIEFAGVLGPITQIMTVWIYVFLIYAGVLYRFGCIDAFLDVGKLISSRNKAFVPMSAIVSSMFMGSILGSAVANTTITGSITIPLMKDQGLRAEVAAAIESVASTGGQILPPIMAAVAFIIAARLGISYGEVIIAGSLPAILFFLVVLASSILYTGRDLGFEQLSGESTLDVEHENIGMFLPFAISILVLIYALVILRVTPSLGGLMAIAAFVIPAALYELYTEPNIDSLSNSVKKFVHGTVDGTVTLAPLTILVAGLEIVVTILGSTGLPNSIALTLLRAPGITLLGAAIIVMVVSILFGMGMPTIPAYLFTAALAVPILIEFDVSQLSAHFFIFYYAVLSNVSPPIALAPAVASRIAGGDFIETAFISFHIALPIYFIPFLFIYRPELIQISFPQSLYTFVIASIVLLVIILLMHLLSLRYNATRKKYFS